MTHTAAKDQRVIRPGHHRPLGTTSTMRFTWANDRLPELGDVAFKVSGAGVEAATVSSVGGEWLTCGCGDRDCWTFSLGYTFCAGCGEHHREPVGIPCPVDVNAFRWHCERMLELCPPEARLVR